MTNKLNVSKELERIIQEIQTKSIEVGLDFFTTIFELVDYKRLHEVAAYGGLPTRYPHWRWGMEFEKLIKTYEYGLTTIYEMVINNDPCYSYLLDSNNLTTQKTVIAHVYAHSDFFKNNIWFSKTNRKMLDQSANNATIVREIIEQVNYPEVESFIDTCLSLENLLDPSELITYHEKNDKPKEIETKNTQKRPKIKSKKYMENFINIKKTNDNQSSSKKKIKSSKKKEFNEERDVLKFLCNNAPLSSWQVKILEIIRNESYYYLPQKQTKILNEGWATYWHSKMMTELYPLDPSEIIDYCNQYASIVEESNNQINPYRLGSELLRHIERRWNSGKFGIEFLNSDNSKTTNNWKTEQDKGRKKIFEVRKIHNDLTFIDNFFDEEFCHETKMFLYDYNPKSKSYVISSRDFKKIKSYILQSLTNCGCPVIKVIDNNFNNKGELLLKHFSDGQNLHQDKSLETLKRLFSIWQRPIHLETLVDRTIKRLTFNGSETTVNKI